MLATAAAPKNAHYWAAAPKKCALLENTIAKME